jgi:diaminopimelate epimerase
MKFVKMQGCGNDYVYLDAVREPAVAAMMERADWAGRVVRMSDRHKGIGSDGVIVVCPPTAAGKSGGASVRMRMFNADGSESEMCGNGVRCVAKFAHDRLGVNARPMKVETGRGVLGIAYEVSDGKLVSATVDMGEAILDLEQIPIAIEHIRFPDPEWKNARQGEFDIRLPSNSSVRLIAVSMGNPHVVWFRARDLVGSERLERDVLARMGSEIETFKAFPRRTTSTRPLR